jgi:hypothetical protein
LILIRRHLLRTRQNCNSEWRMNNCHSHRTSCELSKSRYKRS